MNAAAVIKFFGGVRGSVLACIAFVLLLVASVQTWRLGNAQDAKDDALVEIGQWKEVNQTNYANVLRLHKIVEDWAGLHARAKARLKSLLAAKVERDARRTKARATVDANRVELYKENEDVSQWGDAPVPSAVYDSLLDAHRAYQDADR